MRNELSGRIRLDGEGSAPSRVPFEVESSRIPCFAHNRLASYRNESTGNHCWMVGYACNLHEMSLRYHLALEQDVEVVEALYAQEGLEPLANLDGMFTVFVYDAAHGKAFLFQDELACNVPVYYAHTEAEVVFSTSLKRLLRLLPFERALDLQGCHDFLFNGLVVANVIPSEKTLVRDVFNLTPGRCLEVDVRRRAVRLRPLARTHRRMTTTEARQNLLRLIGASVEASSAGMLSEGVALALSGGYDTNYVLHVLRSLGRRNITGFTIGGRKVNEIPQAAAITEHYGDVKHVTSIVDESETERLPDLVWRLEGYVFQSGVFLQHELGTLVARAGVSSLLVAEGADQFLNSRFHLRLIREGRRSLAAVLGRRLFVLRHCSHGWRDTLKVSRLVGHLWWSASRRCSYYIMLDGILKKSGIMLNSVGVQGIYPYLARPVRDAGLSIGLRASYKKAHYRKLVREAIDPAITHVMKKTGGTTDVEFLFSENMPAIIAALRRSSVVAALLPRGGVDEIARRPDLHWHLAAELLALHLFDELFISGHYDELFEHPSLDIPLTAFLEDPGARGRR